MRRSVTVLGFGWAMVASAWAWTATTPGGETLVIVDQRLPGGETHRLERRLPDGRPDLRYGAAGGQAFMLSPEGDAPTLLVADATGRAWVAGSAMTNDGLRSVVLRFTPQGLPDRPFGRQGRAELAPGGHETRPLRLLPLADGAAWVAGVWADDMGDERPGLWRIRADGLLDAAFGQAGLWQLPGEGAAEPVALQAAPSGEAAAGFRRSDGSRQWLEAWALRSGQAPRPLPPQPLPANDADTWQLAWRDGGWAWHNGRDPQPAQAAAPAAQEATETALATPFVDRPVAVASAAAAAAAPADSGSALGWWLLPLAAAGGWWWWRRPGR